MIDSVREEPVVVWVDFGLSADFYFSVRGTFLFEFKTAIMYALRMRSRLYSNP